MVNARQSRLALAPCFAKRSDIIRQVSCWPEAADLWHRTNSAAIWGAAAVAPRRSGRQHVTPNGHLTGACITVGLEMFVFPDLILQSRYGVD